MNGRTKKSALLFIIVMFAVLGMLSIGNESFADDKETITTQQVVTNSATYENKIFTVDSSSSYDGAIFVDSGELTVTNSDFINSVSGAYGGGISTYKGKKISVSGSTFTGNTAGELGGAIYNDSVAEISNSSFTSNTANKEGGAIWNENSLTILANTVFEGNRAADIGGAICNSLNAEQLTIKKGIVFKNNISDHDGGAIGNYSGAIIAEGAKFIGNKAQTGTSDTNAVGGGAISLGAVSSLSLNEAEFTNNESGYNGGAIGTRSGLVANNSSAKLDILNSTFTGNKATGTATSTSAGQTLKGGNGGAIDNHFYNSETNSGYVTVADSIFTSNTAINGGAIYNHSEKDKAGNAAAIKITNSTFKGNQATSDGGAIANAGNAIINGNTSFENNSAVLGGAIYNTGTAEVTGTFSGNSATNTGGAIFNYSGGTLNVLEGSKFSNNSSAKWGGAIFNDESGANLEITDATFTNNSAEFGGAIFNATSSIAKINGATFSGNTDSTGKNDIQNDGEMSLAGNVKFDGGITGTGSTSVLADAIVDNSNGTLTQNSVSVAEGASLTTNVAKISVTNGIDNAGTVTLIGNGEIATKFSGSGILALDTDGTISLNKTDLVANNNIDVNKGTFKIGSNVSSLTNKLTFNDNGTLDLMNGTKTTVTDFNVKDEKSDVTAFIDFNDKIDTSNSDAANNLSIKKIDLSAVGVGNTESVITQTLATNLGLDSEVELINSGNYSYVALNQSGTTATLIAKNTESSSWLNEAIKDTAAQRIYQMNDSEEITKGTMQGTLVVNGNGNTISSKAENLGGGIVLESQGTTSAVLSLVDANLDSIKVNDDNKGAITVGGDSSLSIIAKNHDVTISNTIGNTVNNAIYLKADITNPDEPVSAEAGLLAHAGRTITINDDIRSNDMGNTLNISGDGTVVLNGVLDPLTAVTEGNVKVQNNNYDEGITWALNGGTLTYSNDKYLYDSAYHDGTTHSLNSIAFNGGTLNLMNGVVSNIKLENMILSGNSNLYLDVDLANASMDRFSDDTAVTYSSGTLNIAGLNLISDTAQEYTSINFTNNENLKGHVAYTGSHTVSKAFSPIYKYDVDYNNQTGNFGFRRAGHNPSIYAGAVGAQVGSYLGQLNVYEQAFANMDMLMLMSKEQRMAMKYANKYAASTSDLIYDGTKQIPEQVAGGWFRPFATFENVGLKGGINVQNIAYGSLFGGDSEILELGHGWDAVVTPYVGYLGSHQSYDGVGIYQNGGVLGLSSAFYKGNFFTGLTANAGANVGEASTMYGNDTFTMLTAGIASKTGYNWELAKGKFIIQPSLLLSYTFVNTFNYRTASGVGINSDPIHGIQVAPGVKFIGNLKNGWQPYVGIQMVWNIIDQTRFQANEVALEQLSVRPYIQYGVGVQKRWGERFTGFGQAMIRNGGRNGVALSVGFRWALGKESASNTTKTKDFSYNPKTNINLSSLNK